MCSYGFLWDFRVKPQLLSTECDRRNLLFTLIVRSVVWRQSRLTPGSLQATLSKLLTYCVLRPTQPPPLSGTGNE